MKMMKMMVWLAFATTPFAHGMMKEEAEKYSRVPSLKMMLIKKAATTIFSKQALQKLLTGTPWAPPQTLPSGLEKEIASQITQRPAFNLILLGKEETIHTADLRSYPEDFLHWSPNDTMLAGKIDQQFKVFNSQDLTAQQSYDFDIQKLTWSPDNQHIALSFDQQEDGYYPVKIFNIKEKVLQEETINLNAPAEHLDFHPDGIHLLIVHAQAIEVWNTRTKTIHRETSWEMPQDRRDPFNPWLRFSLFSWNKQGNKILIHGAQEGRDSGYILFPQGKYIAQKTMNPGDSDAFAATRNHLSIKIQRLKGHHTAMAESLRVLGINGNLHIMDYTMLPANSLKSRMGDAQGITTRYQFSHNQQMVLSHLPNENFRLYSLITPEIQSAVQNLTIAQAQTIEYLYQNFSELTQAADKRIVPEPLREYYKAIPLAIKERLDYYFESNAQQFIGKPAAQWQGFDSPLAIAPAAKQGSWAAFQRAIESRADAQPVQPRAQAANAQPEPAAQPNQPRGDATGDNRGPGGPEPTFLQQWIIRPIKTFWNYTVGLIQWFHWD